jgi:hypothetical protein
MNNSQIYDAEEDEPVEMKIDLELEKRKRPPTEAASRYLSALLVPERNLMRPANRSPVH